MTDIKLKLTKKLEFPLEADTITPDNFAGKSTDEIKKLTVYYGNQKATIGDYFSVTGKGGDLNGTRIIIDGDLSNVKRIGEKMMGGEIVVNGNVGMHLGSQMSGGKILVNGNADDWAGAMMEGGELEITGDAGNYVGAAYRGHWKGMKNGVIKVKGKVGHESMSWVNGSKPAKRFPTLICGGAGNFLGVHGHGGTIIVEGDCIRCTGADQVRGTIIVKGKVLKMLPSYKKIGEVNEIELMNGDKIKGKFIEYSGDHSVEKNHSKMDKQTGKPSNSSNGRIYIAA
ncbi:MAG: formylmethanofuran dehydrogenase subunit C [Candidatus Lokiarchaeota archaeon]|nr:formylmethanofuran dehydrogenase subunit C [Candidatus Lokiarchaeota archaeon]